MAARNVGAQAPDGRLIMVLSVGQVAGAVRVRAALSHGLSTSTPPLTDTGLVPTRPTDTAYIVA